MLIPCHEENKLLHYGNKHSRLFNKGECFIRKLEVIPFKAHQESITKIEPKLTRGIPLLLKQLPYMVESLYST